MATSRLHSSGDLTADRRYAFAKDLAARGDVEGAADLLVQTVELAPGFAAAWFALGANYTALGRKADAIAAFRQAIAADPQDHHGAQLHLIRLGAESVGDMPPEYVREVFDQYAARFDDALTRGLAYKAPEMLRNAVQRACEAAGREFQFKAMLDLGCGTGLGGAAFRPAVDRLVGIDLSPNMVAIARAKNIYDELAVAEIMDYLANESSSERFDLVIAADVFAYLPDLHAVVAACAKILSAGGLLSFTVETHGGEGIILGEKLRYAHAEAHVRSAIETAALDLVGLEIASTRNEAGVPVPGLLAVAQRKR
ncbi:MAG: methyltransferase [Xanthobacteraceae bacterium]